MNILFFIYNLWLIYYVKESFKSLFLIIIKIINIVKMRHLKTIDPIKGLKGKLNFLKYENQPILEVLKLANSLTANK